MKRVSLVSLALLLIVGFPRRAGATLGSDVASVETDRAQMRAAQLRIVSGEAYTLREFRAPSGTIVREYVSPGGTVFGVAWQGPTVPDLRQVLGSYFDSYIAAVRTARGGRAGHGPLSIDSPGLVVQVAGHQHAFQGRVYVPTLLPRGVDAAGVR